MENMKAAFILLILLILAGGVKAQPSRALVRLFVSETKTMPSMLVRNAPHSVETFGLYKSVDDYKVWDPNKGRFLEKPEIQDIQDKGQGGKSFETLVKEGIFSIRYEGMPGPVIPAMDIAFIDFKRMLPLTARPVPVRPGTLSKEQVVDADLLKSLGFTIRNESYMLEFYRARNSFARDYGISREAFSSMDIKDYEKMLSAEIGKAAFMRRCLEENIHKYGYASGVMEDDLKNYFLYHKHQDVRFKQEFFDNVVRLDEECYNDIQNNGGAKAAYKYANSEYKLFVYDRNGSYDTWMIKGDRVTTRIEGNGGITLITDGIASEYKAGKNQDKVFGHFTFGEEEYVFMNTVFGDELWMFHANGVKRYEGFDEGIKILESIMDEAVRAHSDEAAVFLRASAYTDLDGQIRIQCGDQVVHLNTSEFERVLSGETQTLPAALLEVLNANRGKKIIVLRDCYLQGMTLTEGVDDVITPAIKLRGDQAFKIVNGHRLASRINELTHTRVFYSESFERARAVNASINIEGAHDIAVVNASGLGLTDFGFYTEHFSMMKRKGFKTNCSTDPSCVADQKVVLIFAHKEEEFRQVVNRLAQNNGLRDKYLLSFSCFANDDAAFTQQLIRETGLRGVHIFDERINGRSTKDVLHYFTKKFVDEGGDIQTLLQKSIEHVQLKMKDEDLKNGVKKLKAGTWFVIIDQVPEQNHSYYEAA